MKIIKCLICLKDIEISKNVRPFTNHLKKEHSSTVQNYYDEYLKKDDNEGVCPICGNQTYFHGIESGYAQYCSKSCSSNGPNNVFKRKEIQDQIKQTNLKKYGFENASKHPDVIKKARNTCMKRYGVPTSLLHPEVQKKIEKVNIEKYGFANPFDNKEIQEKAQNTIKKKYGGMGHASKTINKRIEGTTTLRFGEGNWSKTLEGREFFRECWIRDFELQSGDKLRPRKGHYEDEVFTELQNNIAETIEFDHVIHGYFPDAYIPELDLILELDEPWHKLEWSVKHDSIKDKTYEKYGYHYYRIELEEWLDDKNKVKSKIKQLITRIKNPQLKD